MEKQTELAPIPSGFSPSLLSMALDGPADSQERILDISMANSISQDLLIGDCITENLTGFVESSSERIKLEVNRIRRG